jgi:hypothetical protein
VTIFQGFNRLEHGLPSGSCHQGSSELKARFVYDRRQPYLTQSPSGSVSDAFLCESAGLWLHYGRPSCSELRVMVPHTVIKRWDGYALELDFSQKTPVTDG